MSDEQTPPLNPTPKLGTFPLQEVGDQIIDMLAAFGITSPVCFIAVADADTGEIMSSSNLEDDGAKDFIQFLAESHAAGKVTSTPADRRSTVQ